MTENWAQGLGIAFAVLDLTLALVFFAIGLLFWAAWMLVPSAITANAS
jgi:hypothetical protein